MVSIGLSSIADVKNDVSLGKQGMETYFISFFQRTKGVVETKFCTMVNGEADKYE